jgi:hypothetical protein
MFLACDLHFTVTWYGQYSSYAWDHVNEFRLEYFFHLLEFEDN